MWRQRIHKIRTDATAIRPNAAKHVVPSRAQRRAKGCHAMVAFRLGVKTRRNVPLAQPAYRDLRIAMRHDVILHTRNDIDGFVAKTTHDGVAYLVGQPAGNAEQRAPDVGVDRSNLEDAEAAHRVTGKKNPLAIDVECFLDC